MSRKRREKKKKKKKKKKISVIQRNSDYDITNAIEKISMR